MTNGEKDMIMAHGVAVEYPPTCEMCRINEAATSMARNERDRRAAEDARVIERLRGAADTRIVHQKSFALALAVAVIVLVALVVGRNG